MSFLVKSNLQAMKVVTVSECFDDVDGEMRYLFTKVLFKIDDLLFQGRSRDRLRSDDLSAVDPESITHIVPIPSETFCPPYPAGCVQALNPTAVAYHIKKPSLVAYEEGSKLDELVLRELAACEILREHSHPNVAQYHGCQVSNGRIIGLCFTRYRHSLQDMVNPDHLNKNAFLSSSRRLTMESIDRYVAGIESGLRHIHSLGLVHNDINPSNVMFDSDDIPVIIDFDSCSHAGESLSGVKQTFGWHDPDVQISTPDGDLAALAEIRVWLTASTQDEFCFKC
ncbi:MAG: hypothetical protein M4579_004096 [Chaenotheca gracillima]|nr:MAG: hypothetical protein M4579_004096 [Chaenotheca gracillima]